MLNLADMFKALGEPVRLRLFSLLASSGEVCVCHLTDALELPQSTVSRHLGVLRHAGLVVTRRDGKWMYYKLADGIPTELLSLLHCSRAANSQLALDMERLSISSSC